MGALVFPSRAHTTRHLSASRLHRQRASDDLELNFLYTHYTRMQRFPTAQISSSRISFLYVQECVKSAGVARCGRVLQKQPDFICFNDRASSEAVLRQSASNVRRLLRERFGTF